MWTFSLVALAAEPPPPVAGMAGHFQEATVTMLSVALAQVDDARVHAKTLAKRPGAPEPLVDAAKQVADCKKVKCAGPAIGLLARTCAECHAATGSGPRPAPLDAVPGSTARERHVWAALFAWIGLVTPMDAPFTLGLNEALPPVDLDSPDEIVALNEAFRASAEQALATTSIADRAAAFGAVVQACAACHEAANVPTAR